jgi:hypothetical protein
MAANLPLHRLLARHDCEGEPQERDLPNPGILEWPSQSVTPRRFQHPPEKSTHPGTCEARFFAPQTPAMSLQTYHILHLVGLILVFVGFGGLLSSDGARKAMKWHGIGLVVSLVSGFGMLAKMGIMGSMPVWVWIKIALWLVLGFLPVLSKRRVLSAPVVVLIAMVVGAVLAYLGYMKPAF